MSHGKTTITGTVLLVAPIVAHANGGLPIIFLINTYAFIAGSIFVLTIETCYLKKVFNKISTGIIFRKVVWINFLSTIFGVTIIPVFFFASGLDPILYAIDSSTTKETMTRVWWVSLSLNLVLAFSATVLIEQFFLARAAFTKGIESTALLKHTILFNLLSYASLIFLIAVTVTFFTYGG